MEAVCFKNAQRVCAEIREKMRIAFASRDNGVIDQHFGSARYWQIYDLDGGSSFVETRKVPVIYEGHHEGRFRQLLSVLEDCDAVFVSHIGESAAEYMYRHNKRVFEAAGEVSEIITELLSGDLLKE